MAKANMNRVIAKITQNFIPVIYDFLREDETDEQAAERASCHQLEEIDRLGNCCKGLSWGDLYSREYWETCLQNEMATDYKVMSYDEFAKLLRDYAYSMMILSDSTEEEFEEMLGVLPPLHHIRCGNVESFCLSEFEFDSYTHQYARDHSTDRYYKKLVNILDKSTWISEDLYPTR